MCGAGTGHQDWDGDHHPLYIDFDVPISQNSLWDKSKIKSLASTTSTFIQEPLRSTSFSIEHQDHVSSFATATSRSRLIITRTVTTQTQK